MAGLNKIKGRHIYTDKKTGERYTARKERVWHIPKEYRPLKFEIGDLALVQIQTKDGLKEAIVQVTEVFREEILETRIRRRFVLGKKCSVKKCGIIPLKYPLEVD